MFDFIVFFVKINTILLKSMKFKIETWNNNSILREVSTPIKKNEYRDFFGLWAEMVKFLKNPDNNWVGLAAPQIWYNKRLIAVSLLRDYEDKNFKTIIMINPEILDCSSEQELDNEWCLSVPKKFWDVLRYKKIKIKYIDSKWKENILILEWLSSRIIQHEIDHLDWILFTDKIVKTENEWKQL